MFVGVGIEGYFDDIVDDGNNYENDDENGNENDVAFYDENVGGMKIYNGTNELV